MLLRASPEKEHSGDITDGKGWPKSKMKSSGQAGPAGESSLVIRLKAPRKRSPDAGRAFAELIGVSFCISAGVPHHLQP